MSTDEFLANYEAALKAQYKAEITVKVLEMRAKMQAQTIEPAKPKKKTTLEKFVSDHSGQLSDSDLEFLSQPQRATADVAKYLEIHANIISKRLREGEYKAGRSDRAGKRMVDTLSVVKTFFDDGKTKKK